MLGTLPGVKGGAESEKPRSVVTSPEAQNEPQGHRLKSLLQPTFTNGSTLVPAFHPAKVVGGKVVRIWGKWTCSAKVLWGELDLIQQPSSPVANMT